RASPPSEDAVARARQAARLLAPLLDRFKNSKEVQIQPDTGSGAPVVTVPVEAFQLFVQILGLMANGNAVTVVPIHAELTTQEAAALLNVSRPFLIRLLESGAIPYTKVGTHRRVTFKNLREYKQRDDQARKKTADALAALEQELGIED